MILKISDALDINIDFLVGKTDLELDSQTLKRIEAISSMSEEKRKYVFSLIDMAIRDYKTQNAYAS